MLARAARAAAAASASALVCGKTTQAPALAWHAFAPARSVASSAAPPVAAEVISKARRMGPPVGVVAGLFGSMVGVGGGVVIVPAIVSACKNIPQRLVSGTSLAAVLSTALASAATFTQGGCVDFAAAALLSPFALLTAPLGARLTNKLNCTQLRRILGIFLMCVAPLIPAKAYFLSLKQNNDAEAADELETTASNALGETSAANAPAEPRFSFSAFIERPFEIMAAVETPKALALAATGSVAGLASGLLGIGGGTIVTPLLALLFPYSQATVLGTSLAAMVVPSSAALAQHARLGNVDWRLAAGLALGTALGSALGSNAAIQAPPGVLEGVFAVGMLFLGRKTLATAK